MECAFTSPVIIEFGRLVMYCMQFDMLCCVYHVHLPTSINFQQTQGGVS